MADDNAQNMNVPSRPEPTHSDQRINPVPDEKERADREADKLAHKGVEREHEFDNMQKPFTKQILRGRGPLTKVVTLVGVSLKISCQEIDR